MLDDTVLNVVVRFKSKTNFSSLGLDMSKFHAIVNPENPNNVAYSNSDAGIMYVISKRDDLVSYVQYGATGKDCLDAKSGLYFGWRTQQIGRARRERVS